MIPFNPTLLPISDCQGGTGSLAPLFLNVLDVGNLEITDTAGAFVDVEEAKAKVSITIFGADALWCFLWNGQFR